MIALSKPYYQKGELVWLKEKGEVAHVVDRWEGVDSDDYLYRVADPTHTTSRFYRQEPLRRASLQLGVTVQWAKPVEKLDLDALIQRLDEQDGAPHLNLEDNLEKSGEKQ